MNKHAAEKIATEYYNLGIQLALKESGLLKIANSTKSKKTPVQKMTMPAMGITPSEGYSKADKQKRKGRAGKTPVRDYLEKRRRQLAYSNAGLPTHGSAEEKMLDRSMGDANYAREIEHKLRQGDPG